MGEKPVGRILVMSALLLASLFVGLASADAENIVLSTDIESLEGQPWYDVDHPLVMTPSLTNTGSSELQFTINPACEFVLNVYNDTGVQVVDGTEACPDRSTGENLFAGQTKAYESLTWDMKTNDGAWLESGAYTVELMHTTLGHSLTVEAVAQTPVTLPEGLEFSVEFVDRLSDGSGPSLMLVSVHNPSTEIIDIESLPTCFLEYAFDETYELGAPCFGGVNTLMPSEVLLVAQKAWMPSEDATLQISTPGDDFVQSELLAGSGQAEQTVEGVLNLQFLNSVEPLYGTEQVMETELQLVSTTDEPQTLTYTSSCKAELWVVDDLGRTVFDSRAIKTCSDIDLEAALEGDGTEVFTLPQWNFAENDACYIQPGRYTVVGELPEFGMFSTTTIDFTNIEADACLGSQGIDVELETSWSGEATLLLESVLTNEADANYLRMAQPCTFEIEFIDADGTSVHGFQTLCGDYDGRKMLVPQESSDLTFPPIEIEMVQNGAPILADGFYTLNIELLSSIPVSTSVDIAWPEGFVAEDSSTNNDGTDLAPLTFELTGTWTGLLTETGTCFVLAEGEETYLLSNAKTIASWSPSSTMQGLYRVISAESSPECSTFSAPSVEVVEVKMEQPLEQEIAEESTSSEPTLALPSEETSAVVAVTTVVITASLLSVIGLVAITNESLRIPATMAGLWFLGLIGKTHETTDGRYQRGRLMGYLTANPGCHFRALMSALDMSNGQITHHLRVLEAEEHIWRKNDGRLVRYYPLTNQLHPNMNESELPVPPLSPDPNSLQGKILNLLDQDGGLGQFPTQAELAKRLEKSQQLISHHLRTLQKYGLVERRKMGVKNRYKLTREAIFLLETSDDFGDQNL